MGIYICQKSSKYILKMGTLLHVNYTSIKLILKVKEACMYTK